MVGLQNCSYCKGTGKINGKTCPFCELTYSSSTYESCGLDKSMEAKKEKVQDD